MVNGDTELRHLSLSQKRELGEILEVRDSWKVLMSAIEEPPSQGDPGGGRRLKYTARDLSVLEREAKVNPRLTGAEILFDEWGTSGRQRPTLTTLVNLLTDLKLYRAADYVSMNLLGGAPVQRQEQFHRRTLTDLMETKVIKSTDEPAAQLEAIPYPELESCCGWDYKEQGKEECIGVGAFACVFKAIVPAVNGGKPVAVKRFHQGNSKAGKQYEVELEALKRIKHRNIVRMLGYSEGTHRCLVLELLDQGNLEDNLACKRRSQPISWRPRVQIALGTAEALAHLHSQKLVHRDIKSANILLDEALQPKLADFGLMQEEDDEEQDSESELEIAGTSCYMSPEAITYGKVTLRGDVFSFGVVLLELLTSLPADDDNRTFRSLLLHVEEICGENSVAPLLDTKAGLWGGKGQPVAHVLYNLAVHCVNRRDDMRPNISSAVEKLVDILAVKTKVVD
ncbi:uncharacterized protein LOC132196136 [Neocloeon triangulifer]|uniref:uncharacterized protein LOC132196136 n=1 Tax=Neocloeon triangulifer TaxID=2078957 RepID=UPI00286FAAB3|nr:uncharacterized protein LOC132196136 [Neocloeon triangulifer]